MQSNRIGGLYLITDTSIQSRYTHVELAEMALQNGARIIQLRDKKKDALELMHIGEHITRLCDNCGAYCIINDRVDVAFASDAHGVHLGQNDLPVRVARNMLGDNKIIGGSASTLQEARYIEKQGADYVGFGHIFATTSKQKHYKPRGIKLLQQVLDTVSIPVIAIGGINTDNFKQVLDTGSDGIAVISSICRHPDPAEATRLFTEQMRLR